jgi:hypothetical protein
VEKKNARTGLTKQFYHRMIISARFELKKEAIYEN